MKRLMREAQAPGAHDCRRRHRYRRRERAWVRSTSKHGERALEKLLAPPSAPPSTGPSDKPARFLAKRFAAKEAFGKALGIGVAAPATLPNIAVDHDSLGKPDLRVRGALAALLAERGLVAHLSISDEHDCRWPL
jgi:holo-[acyl-carrier protein] synthase